MEPKSGPKACWERSEIPARLGSRCGSRLEARKRPGPQPGGLGRSRAAEWRRPLGGDRGRGAKAFPRVCRRWPQDDLKAWGTKFHAVPQDDGAQDEEEEGEGDDGNEDVDEDGCDYGTRSCMIDLSKLIHRPLGLR